MQLGLCVKDIGSSCVAEHFMWYQVPRVIQRNAYTTSTSYAPTRPARSTSVSRGRIPDQTVIQPFNADLSSVV